MHVLSDVNDSYKKKKAQLCLRNPSADVMSKLVASGLEKSIGEDYIFACMHDALNGCLIELGKMEEEGSLRTLEIAADGKEHKL
mmetsp:Transcript_7437/g.7624  ORF Transcript_7437/g.7624 Transcript_7437/m.7624 type:complete len:84 (+) Transcript_7437:45-296(+)